MSLRPINTHRPDDDAQRSPTVPAAIRGLIIKALGCTLTIVILAILSSPAAADASTISCSPGSVIVAQSTNCTVMVTDRSTSYSFTTNGPGSFQSNACKVVEEVCGPVSYTPSAVGKGAHTITATSSFCGPNTKVPACPFTVVTVTGRPTSTAVACSPGAVVLGQSTTCTATVTEPAGAAAAPPTGMVSFASSPAGGFGGGSTCVLSANRTSAGCSVTFTPSAVGTGVNTVTASYGGDSQYAAARGSAVVTVTAPVTVTPPVPPPAPAPPPVIPPAKASSATTVTCSPGTVAVRHATTCTATVTDGAGATPTGTVSFATSGPGRFGPGASCVLSGVGASTHCSVTFTPTQAASATVTITAAYGGDSAHAGGSGLTTVAFPPAAGVMANVTVIQGVVLISEPTSGQAHTARASTASGSLEPLKGSTTAVPVGSTIDARKGTIEMATAADYRGAVDPRHRLQTGVFSAGMFSIAQMTAKQALAAARRQHKRRVTGIPATNLRLTNNANALMAARCRRSGAPGKGIVRSIHGVAKGLFDTIGAASITTVQNATWTVEDRCDGTLTEVGRGRATVASMHLHQRTVTVKAGEAYLVTARFLAGPRKGIGPR